MSKVSEAKQAQGYSEDRLNCGNCKHLTKDMVLPEWMAQENADALAAKEGIRYDDSFKREKNLRCGIGKFAIKKTAICGKHES